MRIGETEALQAVGAVQVFVVGVRVGAGKEIGLGAVHVAVRAVVWWLATIRLGRGCQCSGLKMWLSRGKGDRHRWVGTYRKEPR